MLNFLYKIKILFLFLFILLNSNSRAEIINKIIIDGNNRISTETIVMFSGAKVNEDLNDNDLNQILKKLYETNFFELVSVKIKDNILNIKIKENPIIQNITYEGIKSSQILEKIKEDVVLKSRSSFNKIILEKDREKINNSLKNLGYYFSEIDISIEELEDNKINLFYNISLGKKAKIKKISFIGNKIYKDKKLKSVILSEEYKAWKFLSGKKYLNEVMIKYDKRLLKNFYLNKGYFNVVINSSFAKMINDQEFELIFNIEANPKLFFGKLNINLPSDFSKSNYDDLEKLFKKLENEPYSLYHVEDILEKIETITINEQYESIKATVKEDINLNKINISFNIEETEKVFIEKINIFGNNVTRESVIRNQIEIDEGDPFNEILYAKSLNNIKSLNFFESVKGEILDGNKYNSKIININIKEKATGEIFAGIGTGTSGSNLAFGIKENNYLGRGVKLDTNLSLSEERIKGNLSISNPNFRNSDKDLNLSIESTSTDRISTYGYKSSKTGFSIGTNFEYLDDLRLGLSSKSYVEEITVDSTASTKQKKQEGSYFDSFIGLDFNYDKRNQKFQTTGGFYSNYSLELPVLSETNTLTNSYNYKVYKELYENNVSTLSLLMMSSNSLTGDDIKLSERLYIPQRRLRGFERGKVGPKDQSDFIGGNYLTTINATSTVPKILENVQNMDLIMFADVGNVWGVDYNNSLDDSDIRSSIGVGLDWLTPVGPLSFSFAHPISKKNTDITETFRFNLGTTF
jgi:outer membrane protein insertion porin family